MDKGTCGRQSMILLAAIAFTGLAPAADYPVRAVKVITQGAAGSGPDVVARIVGEALSQAWRQPVSIVNAPGGGGLVAAKAAAAAEPDGYTLYAPTITTFVILPEMFDPMPVDLDRDFTRVGLLAETPMVIGVASSTGIRSLAELIERASAKPGELFYAANNRGSLPHLTGEMFAQRAGVRLTFVPYPGAAAGLQDVLGGRVPMIVESVGALAGVVLAGNVRPLAVTSPQRLPQWPDVPAVAEFRPGFSSIAWFALLAPAATPPAVVSRINEDLNRVLVQPDVRRKLQELGATPKPMSPKETDTFIRNEQQAWRPVVRQIDLKSK